MLIADQSLSKEVKGSKIQVLIKDKNTKLNAILSPDQQERVIATTEREPKKRY